MKYTATQIKLYSVNRGVTKHGITTWKPARPLMYWSFRRFKMAWFVLIGKYDALDWEE